MTNKKKNKKRDALDHNRIKAQRPSETGFGNFVDDILTKKNTAELPYEDLHEELGNKSKRKKSKRLN